MRPRLANRERREAAHEAGNDEEAPLGGELGHAPEVRDRDADDVTRDDVRRERAERQHRVEGIQAQAENPAQQRTKRAADADGDDGQIHGLVWLRAQ